jgi:hypothetical protein
MQNGRWAEVSTDDGLAKTECCETALGDKVDAGLHGHSKDVPGDGDSHRHGRSDRTVLEQPG